MHIPDTESKGLTNIQLQKLTDRFTKRVRFDLDFPIRKIKKNRKQTYEREKKR